MAQRDKSSLDAPTSLDVIGEVAAHSNTDPAELDFTLHDYIDPDALDALLGSAADELVVAFSIEDVFVTVSNDGCIEIVDQDKRDK